MRKAIFILFIHFLITNSILARIIHVPIDKPTIQAGIDAAAPGDTVLADDNIYVENISFKGKPITVASRFILDDDSMHIENTIIYGKRPSNPDSGSVVYFDSGEDTTSILCGFTVTGGTGTNIILADYRTKSGGGIFCFNSGGKIINNKISNNHITVGEKVATAGGILSRPGPGNNVIIRENEISNNTVVGFHGCGGGVFLFADGNTWFESNIVSGNLSKANPGYNGSSGGGGINIFIEESDHNRTFITANKIIENEAYSPSKRWGQGYGGGLFISQCSPELVNNIIAGNKSGYGGGIRIVSSAEKENWANPALVNNTIANNRAINNGGISVRFGSQVIAINCIIWANIAVEDSLHIAIDEDSSIDVLYSDIQGGWPGEGNIDADPKIINKPGNPGYFLNYNSPCIDRGIDSIMLNGKFYVAPSCCYHGTHRPFGAGFDIGACEWDGTDLFSTTQSIPDQFSLKQNYPNPFNPKTIISYQLPIEPQHVASVHVDLSIYNILGQKVATLVSAKQPAGKYKVEWDASGFASGIYLYRLETDYGFAETRKLVLLK